MVLPGQVKSLFVGSAEEACLAYVLVLLGQLEVLSVSVSV